MPLQINEALITPSEIDAGMKTLVEELHRRITELEKAVSALQNAATPSRPLRRLR
jgi:hypothetical protein